MKHISPENVLPRICALALMPCIFFDDVLWLPKVVGVITFLSGTVLIIRAIRAEESVWKVAANLIYPIFGIYLFFR